jgi:gamma-glutamyltranspeptidase/glutathione hydrolase/leukotriene-C4 hydrolase
MIFGAMVLVAIVAFAFYIQELPIRRGPFPTPPNPYPSPGTPRNPAYLIRAEHGAVASENDICSEIGVDVLKEGGSAVDAAIASTLCVGTINMFSSGIGGGGFMTVRIPINASDITKKGTSEVFTIDFRETAPAASNATMFGSDPDSSKFGGLSVGVPGELRGLAEAHRRWGKLPWKRLVNPSVTLAKGWRLGRETARRMRREVGAFILKDPVWARIFAPGGKFLEEGDFIARPNYARTLKLIADEGAEAFYKSPIADAIIHRVHQTGGIMTIKDLQGYEPIVQQALQGTYRGKKVYTTGAPTSGPVLLHILNLLENFNITAHTTHLEQELNVHRVVEALKFGFAARTKLSDPAFMNSTREIEDIPTKKYARAIFPNITDDTTHTAEYYNPLYDVPLDSGTTHTSAVDESGMAAAISSTINLIWGSRILDQDTGIILNDEMDDFSRPGIPNGFGLYPSPYNYPAPGKRPLSSMAPTVIENEDGSFYLTLGGSGGSLIFGSILQVILNAEEGLDISAAVERPRLHDQLFPSTVIVEDRYPKHLTRGLRFRGHNITEIDINLGVSEIQAVVRDTDGILFAASDSRKNGIAAGY